MKRRKREISLKRKQSHLLGWEEKSHLALSLPDGRFVSREETRRSHCQTSVWRKNEKSERKSKEKSH